MYQSIQELCVLNSHVAMHSESTPLELPPIMEGSCISTGEWGGVIWWSGGSWILTKFALCTAGSLLCTVHLFIITHHATDSVLVQDLWLTQSHRRRTRSFHCPCGHNLVAMITLRMQTNTSTTPFVLDYQIQVQLYQSAMVELVALYRCILGGLVL